MKAYLLSRGCREDDASDVSLEGGQICLLGFHSACRHYFPDQKTMIVTPRKAIELILITGILTGVAGFLSVKAYFKKSGVDWWLPDDLSDKSLL